MNKWKNKQKIEVSYNKETILNSQIKDRITQWKILRVEHIREEKGRIEGILSIFNTIIREGIDFNKEEYDKMEKLFKSLNKEYDEIRNKSEDLGKEK